MSTLEGLGQTLDRRWSELDRAEGNGVRVIDLPRTVKAGTILLGLNHDGPRLLIPVPGGTDVPEDRTGSGIHLLVTSLGKGDEARTYLDILCVKPELRWLFATFAADVLLRIERAPDDDPLQLARTCFKSWKTLFARGGRRLSLTELAGLYGELTVLLDLVERSSRHVDRWRGPLREPHDFRVAALAMEVKTTLSVEDAVVRIHGIEQLTPPEAGELFLTHLRVQAPSDSGSSVPDLVADVRDRVPPDRINGLLRAAGYYDSHANEYAGLTFEVVERDCYLVDGSFPRLTRESFPGGDVPVGLGGFTYTLDLGVVITPPLSSGAAAAVLERLAS